ncbi:DUF1028 domain-containing protein [Candidatus Flexifilum breve]|uniref:DUF1028 domain-containing protein n=1 Tax=Candidatus Flexifilum breve TaxID=3140694 RepID=UPI003313038C
MASGISAEETLQRLLRPRSGQGDAAGGHHQTDGRTAAHTGRQMRSRSGRTPHRRGLLSGQHPHRAGSPRPNGVALSTEGELADRLLAPQLAGDRAGGDRRRRQGGALRGENEWRLRWRWRSRYIDLRVGDESGSGRAVERLVSCITSILAKRARKTACRSPRNWCANSN